LSACKLGDTHGIASVKCVGNLGVGGIFAKNKRLLEAKPLLRIALEAAESGDTDWLNEHAVLCSDELCTVLFRLNSIDEAEPIVKRFSKLLKKNLPLARGW
jgi:D-serine dehydratase